MYPFLFFISINLFYIKYYSKVWNIPLKHFLSTNLIYYLGKVFWFDISSSCLFHYTLIEITLFFTILEDMKLNPNETSAMFHGCEFDYTSNTYRLHITLSAGSVTIAENFMVIKVDGATGFPKICSIRWIYCKKVFPLFVYPFNLCNRKE